MIRHKVGDGVSINNQYGQKKQIARRVRRIGLTRFFVALLLWVIAVPASAAIEVYLSAFSAVQGGSIDAFVSSDTDTVDAEIFRVEAPDP